MTHAQEAGPSTATAMSAEELPVLFEEFSRATAGLVASHDALLAQVESLQRELAAKDRRLEHKKRLEAIGRVAAGVAHEFRNPLGGIRLRAERLLGEPQSAKNRERLDQILGAVQHLDRIVEDLLTFTRNSEIVRQPRRVLDLVQHAVALSFPDTDQQPSTLVLDGPPDLTLAVDPVAFTQVLVNLLINAHQATRDSPTPAVGVAWGSEAAGAWIEVADNGPGIPPGEEERIFHPFHSLREGGTGLGLAIVHSRIEAHEGEIALVRPARIDSAAQVAVAPPGTPRAWPGACFRITLPAREETR